MIRPMVFVVVLEGFQGEDDEEITIVVMALLSLRKVNNVMMETISMVMDVMRTVK